MIAVSVARFNAGSTIQNNISSCLNILICNKKRILCRKNHSRVSTWELALIDIEQVRHILSRPRPCAHTPTFIEAILVCSKHKKNIHKSNRAASSLARASRPIEYMQIRGAYISRAGCCRVRSINNGTRFKYVVYIYEFN